MGSAVSRWRKEISEPPPQLRIGPIATLPIAGPLRVEAIAECLRGQATPLAEADLSYAVQHGLAPLLYKNVPDLRLALEERFQQDLKRSLLLSSELCRLLDALPPALAFKGPVLAQRLYGDVAAREYCDLDVLIRPSDLPLAISRLRELGYSGAGFDPWQLQSHIRNGCEYPMSDARVHLELHWRFAPRQFGADFDVERLFARSTNVRVGDRDIPALSPEDDFLMLVVHGTKHAWAKLSWVADVAALLRTCSLDWGYVNAEAARLRIRRMVRVSLLLAQWMGAPVPDVLQREMQTDAEAKAVAGQLRDHIVRTSDPGQEERAAHRLITATLDSPRDRLAYAARYAITPTMDDWNYVRLPRGLRWLYPAARVLRLATRQVRD